MVSSARQAIACILIIFGVAILARAQTVPPKDPTATITGKITIKGKPAPGIFIGLRRQDSSYRRQLTGFRAITDNEGKYRIENVASGSYAIIPVAPAYVSDDASERVLIVNKTETIENVDFVLIRGGAITGKVVNAEGRPLIEEEVIAVPESETIRAQSRYLGARTDDRGIYRLFGLPAGRYRVAAGNETYNRYQRSSYKRLFHPGVEDSAQATLIDVSEGGEVVNIDLTLGSVVTTYTASGKVVDGQTGEPVPNVFYGLSRYFEHGSSSSSPGTATNSRGEFRLENLTPGKYGITVQSRNANVEWRAEEALFEVVDRDVTGLLLKTEKGAVISGVFVIEGADEKTERELLSRANVGASVTNESTGRGTGSSASPAPDGSFRITGLPAGIANFHIYSPTAQFHVLRVERNGVIQTRGIEIKPGEQIAGVKVAVSYGNASIRGSITLENGTMPAGGRFFAWIRKLGDNPNPSDYWSDATQQMDSRGQFIIENLGAGTYEIHAGIFTTDGRSNDYNKAYSKKQEIVVTAGSTTNITITVDLSSTPTRP